MDNIIDIQKLNYEEQQALVCMYFAKLKSDDPRYKNRNSCWKILQKRFNKKINTYKNVKDTFDFYFDNGRQGWKDGKPISSRSKAAQLVYDMYKDIDVDVLEKVTNDIISLYSSENYSFITMKCTFPDTVHKIISGEKEITIDGVYTLQEDLTINKIIFITLGGDRGKKEVDWDPGFYGIGHVTKTPYDFGYNGQNKYFKFDIKMDLCFGKAYKREDFINYIDAYDARYIGPELTRDPSQALSSLSDTKAVAVIRAVLDKQPELKEKLEQIFSAEFIERVNGAVSYMVETELYYGEIVNTNINIEDDKEFIFKTNIDSDIERNIIVYGAPGTGKSYKINKQKSELVVCDNEYERVTFHPDYSYAQFVGTYKPVSYGDTITYEYVPGPFMRVLTSALKSAMSDNPKPQLLIIEEINRANVAAVFGDVFQLLDRDNDGVSEYSIQTSNDMRDYLAKELDLDPSKCTNIRIPNNMFIWATMNSADQGVFPMDTAFKRRWNFEYLDINDGEDKIKGKTVTLGQGDDERKVEWNDLRVAINDFLADECRVNEDKLLGPFFIYNGIIKEDEDIDNQAFINIFKNKVLMYLFEDAAKQKRQTLFEGVSKYNLLSSIMKEFDTKGINIFNKEISNKFTKQTGDDQ